MKTSVQTASALEPCSKSMVLESVCSNCAEFLPSGRTPSVGICVFHAVQVLAQDKACSQYYQDEDCEPVGSDDEF